MRGRHPGGPDGPAQGGRDRRGRRAGQVRGRAGVHPRLSGPGRATAPTGFPGLAGWGAKTTAAVLARYEHLEAIPDAPGQWDVPIRGVAGLAATLAAQRDLAMLFRDLATLRTSPPVIGDVSRSCAGRARAPSSAELCARRARLPSLAGHGPSSRSRRRRGSRRARPASARRQPGQPRPPPKTGGCGWLQGRRQQLVVAARLTCDRPQGHQVGRGPLDVEDAGHLAAEHRRRPGAQEPTPGRPGPPWRRRSAGGTSTLRRTARRSPPRTARRPAALARPRPRRCGPSPARAAAGRRG